jgi:CheY-like chemotaxis protein
LGDDPDGRLLLTDGWDAIEEVRANPATRDLPIVVMSAELSLFTTRGYGVQGYVRPPGRTVGKGRP